MSDENDVSGAAELIAARFNPENEKPKEDTSESLPPAQSEDSGTDEGEVTEADSPTEESPSYEAPTSWKAEDKDAFYKLPPEAQKIVVEREAEREKGINLKLSEAAEQRKQYEAQLSELQKQSTEYSQGLQRLNNELSRQFLGEFADVTDPVQLAQQDPERFVQYQAKLQQLSQIQHAMTIEQEKIKSAEDAKNLEFAKSEFQKLAEVIPEFSKEETRETKAKEIRGYLKSYGFEDADVSSIVDHRMLVIANKAALFDKLQAQKTEVTKKVVDLPKVQKPGVATNASSIKQQKAQEDYSRFQKTGHVNDAARLIRGLI